MIVLLVSNSTGGEIIGKVEGELADDTILLTDVLRIHWGQNAGGQAVPVPVDYPSQTFAVMVTAKAYEDFTKVFEFNTKDYWMFEEEEISDGVVAWYQKVFADKSGIEITDKMPSNIIQ